METAIIAIVALIGCVVSGYDFPTLYFYIALSFDLFHLINEICYTDDKATNGR